VILLGADRVDRLRNTGYIDGTAAERKAIRLYEFIVKIELAQVKRMHGVGHTGRIRVPVQHVKSRRRFAQQIVLYPVIPDQAIGTQAAKGHPHVLAVEITVVRH
jgi:hypothetical protein